MSAQPRHEAGEPAVTPVPTTAGGPELTLLEHLKELRNRVIVCAIAVVVGIALCAVFWETIFGWFLAPAREQIEGFRVVSASPTDRIGTIFKISMYGGLILASPVVVYELLAFVVPGLTPREKRMLLPGLVGSAVFMLAGMAFAYYIVLPQSLGFLLNIGSDKIDNQQRIEEYVGFVIRLVFWTGIAFELPMVLALAARLGLVRARQLFGFWRYAIVIVFILAAIVTPTPDPLTQSLVGGPLLLLYFLGVLFAKLAERPRPKPTAIA